MQNTVGIGQGSPAPWAGLAAACVLLLSAAYPACAATPLVTSEAGQRGEHELSASQAAQLVQKRYGARVVRASSAQQDGRHVYVFRLLSAAGKVWNVRIDAHTGAEVP